MTVKRYYLLCLFASVLSVPAEYQKFSTQMNAGLLMPEGADNVTAIGLGLILYPIVILLFHLMMLSLISSLLSKRTVRIEWKDFLFQKGFILVNFARLVFLFSILAVNIHYITKYNYPIWVNVIYTAIYLVYALGLIRLLHSLAKKPLIQA
jgi:hypothetical protein